MFSTVPFPALPVDELRAEEDASLARELSWLLSSLKSSLSSLKTGLSECLALLDPATSASSTLVLSTRSEALKGFVTRIGGVILKGTLDVRVPSLPASKGLNVFRITIPERSENDDGPRLRLRQISEIKDLVNRALDVVDVSTWTGEEGDANFMRGQMRLLHDTVREAKEVLEQQDSEKMFPVEMIDERIFDPPLPPHVSVDLFITEAALTLELRTLESAVVADSSLHALTSRFAAAFTAPRSPSHDEENKTFIYRGHAVRVKEKIKVESQDPSLMALMAKLSALEHGIAFSRRALDVVMGCEDV